MAALEARLGLRRLRGLLRWRVMAMTGSEDGRRATSGIVCSWKDRDNFKGKVIVDTSFRARLNRLLTREGTAHGPGLDVAETRQRWDDQPDDGQTVVSIRLRSNTAYFMLGREGREDAGMPT